MCQCEDVCAYMCVSVFVGLFGCLCLSVCTSVYMCVCLCFVFVSLTINKAGKVPMGK